MCSPFIPTITSIVVFTLFLALVFAFVRYRRLRRSLPSAAPSVRLSRVPSRHDLNESTPTDPIDASAPTTLHGFPLENRVRGRRPPPPLSFVIPGTEESVRVDPNRLPMAEPPPKTEAERQREREAAERVASPLLYGRAAYKRGSVFSVCAPNTPLGGQRSLSRGSLAFSTLRPSCKAFLEDDEVCGTAHRDEA